MEETQEKYLIDQLNKLSQKFPEVTFTYGFDVEDQIHIIDIQPVKFYNDPEFKISEAKFVSEFYYYFPTDPIIFVSNDEDFIIKSPICSIKSLKN